MKYKAVVFDFDYTLGDSTKAILQGAKDAFFKMGLPQPAERAICETVGYTLKDGYTLLSGDRDPVRRALYRRLFVESTQQSMLRDTVLYAGTIPLLRALKREKVLSAVVSTKSRVALLGILEEQKILPYFSCVIAFEDVQKAKPDPQGLNQALSTLGTPAGSALYVGDTVIDAETAKGGGTDFAAVLTGTTKREQFAGHRCACLAADLWELGKWLGLEFLEKRL